MKIISLKASDQEILDAVQEWVDLLIKERYVDAYEFLHHKESLYSWTPELIAELIQEHRSPESWDNNEMFSVNLLHDHEGSFVPPQYPGARQDVHRYQDDGPEDFVGEIQEQEKVKDFFEDIVVLSETQGGYIWFDLPFGDLTATLDFRVVNNSFVLELNDIRVM